MTAVVLVVTLEPPLAVCPGAASWGFFLSLKATKAAGFAAAFSFDDEVCLFHHVTAASLHACTRTQRAIRFAAGLMFAEIRLAKQCMK
jgi:hypothetical protein